MGHFVNKIGHNWYQLQNTPTYIYIFGFAPQSLQHYPVKLVKLALIGHDGSQLVKIGISHITLTYLYFWNYLAKHSHFMES